MMNGNTRKRHMFFRYQTVIFFTLEKSRGSSGGCRAATRSRAEQRHTIGQKARSRSSRHVPASYQEGINRGICEKRTSNLVCRQSCWSSFHERSLRTADEDIVWHDPAERCHRVLTAAAAGTAWSLDASQWGTATGGNKNKITLSWHLLQWLPNIRQRCKQGATETALDSRPNWTFSELKQQEIVVRKNRSTHQDLRQECYARTSKNLRLCHKTVKEEPSETSGKIFIQELHEHIQTPVESKHLQDLHARAARAYDSMSSGPPQDLRKRSCTGSCKDLLSAFQKIL